MKTHKKIIADFKIKLRGVMEKIDRRKKRILIDFYYDGNNNYLPDIDASSYYCKDGILLDLYKEADNICCYLLPSDFWHSEKVYYNERRANKLLITPKTSVNTTLEMKSLWL